MEDVHFTQVGRAIDVDESRDVFVREVSEERNLAQDAFRERDLLQRAGHHLDRHGLPRDLVRGRAAVEQRGGREKGGKRLGRAQAQIPRRPPTYITKPYAPEPSSRMSFHRFSTWKTLPNDDMRPW